MKIEDLQVSDEVKKMLFDYHTHCEEMNEPLYKYSEVVTMLLTESNILINKFRTQLKTLK